jgi:hypothetical protein
MNGQTAFNPNLYLWATVSPVSEATATVTVAHPTVPNENQGPLFTGQGVVVAIETVIAKRLELDTVIQVEFGDQRQRGWVPVSALKVINAGPLHSMVTR